MVANAAGVVNVPTFPLVNPPAQLRTEESLLQNANEAVIAGNPVRGIKGASAVMLIDGINPILALDYTHDICLRVMAKLLNLWFDQKHHNQAYSIRGRLPEFDALMQHQKAPDFVSRPPRGFAKHIKHWKGSTRHFFDLRNSRI
jgi:hypothetical protein